MKLRHGGILGVRRQMSSLSSATCCVSLDVSLDPSVRSFSYIESGEWNKISLSALFEHAVHSFTQ